MYIYISSNSFWPWVASLVGRGVSSGEASRFMFATKCCEHVCKTTLQSGSEKNDRCPHEK